MFLDTPIFTTQDTFAPQTNYQNPFELNRYAYGANNPVKYSDPSGNTGFAGYMMSTLGKAAAIGFIGGGVFGFAISGFMWHAINMGACGTDAQADLKASGVGPWEYAREGFWQGAKAGTVASVLIASGGILAGSVGAGYTASIIGGVFTGVQAHQTLLDFNACNVALTVLSGAMGTIGAVGAHNAFVNPIAFDPPTINLNPFGNRSRSGRVRIPVEIEDGYGVPDDGMSVGTLEYLQRIENPGQNWPGTNIPQTFEIVINNVRYFVNRNATKHMSDHILNHSYTNQAAVESTLLASFISNLDGAFQMGLESLPRTKFYIGEWNFIFDTSSPNGHLPVIYHAQFE